MIENISVGVTLVSYGYVINTPEDRDHHRVAWFALRLVLVVAAFVSRFLAARLFGPEDSKQSWLIASVVLWLPVTLLKPGILPGRPLPESAKN